MNKRKPPTEQALADLKVGLLRNRPAAALRPDQGAEAFQSHKLLTAEVLRASKLDQMQSESATDAWVRYVATYYPEGRGKGNEADARLLFGEWRTSLTKKDAPGAMVPITHGKMDLHWQRDAQGRLCLNLEDAWDDYASSVEQFVDYVRGSERHKVIFKRAREHDWEVSTFTPLNMAQHVAGATVMDVPVSGASFGTSTTTITFSAQAARSVSADKAE